MPRVFSRETLGKFEDASASIPLRQIDRAFSAAGIALGDDPGGGEGARKTQFRRYLASVDQYDPQQRDRLGDALGALIAEVAPSKVDFLVSAAESSGFRFAGGTFREAQTGARAFAVTRIEELASLDELARRLERLALERPSDAIAGANELAESVCRTIVGFLGETVPKAANLSDIAARTLDALDSERPPGDDATSAEVRSYLQQASAFVTSSGSVQCPSPPHARLAISATLSLTRFLAEAYAECKRRG